MSAAADFPDWLPAMLVKELRQGLRTRGFVFALIAVQAVMALAMLGAVRAAAVVGGSVVGQGTTAFANGLFWTLVGVQLLLIAPIRATGSLHGEISTRGIDLLVLSRLTAWRIVLGKWVSLAAQSALLLIAMLPYGIVRYFAGSTDLVGDARVLCALYATSLFLTAAGLWCGAFPMLIVRVATVAVVVFAVAVAPHWFGAIFSRAPIAPLSVVVLYLNVALLTLFFLVSSVQRVAPQAENHVPLIRAVPLLAAALVPLCAVLESATFAYGQFPFAAGFLMAVCAIELSSGRFPPRRKGNRFEWPLALPGWPSALLYGLAAAIVLMLLAELCVPLGALGHARWLIVLGYGAVIAPTAAIVGFRRHWIKRFGGLYLAIFAGMSVFSAICASMNQQAPLVYSGVIAFFRCLPISGFWLALGSDYFLSDAGKIVTGALIAVALAGALVRSRPYWRAKRE